jgi:hypothetical protein
MYGTVCFQKGFGARDPLFPTLFQIQSGSLFLNIRRTDEEAFMIMFACAILFHIAERIDFLYLCDFMGFSLGMPFSEAP